MKVLVTGAQGCIGAWVVRQLVGRGTDVVACDLSTEPVRLRLIAPESDIAKVKFVAARIEDTATIKALVKDEEITHIIHLAAVLMPFCQANPVSGAMINVVGTLNVFEAARDAGRSVRISYASSSAVWGPEDAYERRALKESDTPQPMTHYGVFKHANENNARIFYATNGISSIGLRPWTVYGVGRDSGLTADPTLAMKAAARREKYQIRLTGHMDLQYAEDIAEAFIRCAFSELEGAHVFNLAGEIILMTDLVKMLERLRPEVAGLISCDGPQVPVAFRMDDSALQAAVPGLPRTSLEVGVRRTIEMFEGLG